ncbi:MAG: hypothetical protein RLZZ292_581 [Bacteroidota bacterium]|jgi:hypothetical protein
MENNYKKLKFDIEDVLDAFSLKRNVSNCQKLDALLNIDVTQAIERADFLEQKRLLLQIEGDFWNEEELKMKFLSHVFDVAAMEVPDKVKTFYERPLTDILDNYKLSVICDMLLASPLGIGKPKKPFFFLQEFKKSKNATDAEGQLLTAMLIAQHQNNNGKPIYGCWLQGKMWNFCTLHDKSFCVSRSYDASQKHDLQQVVLVLMQLKTIILSELL